MKRRIGVAAILVAGLLALGWNPILPPTTYRWNTAAPVSWNPDGGILGVLDNASAIALIASAFDRWADVPTATIEFAQGSQIINSVGVPVDVTPTNYSEVINLFNGQNPIIFDNDREILDALGAPASIGAFATPQFVNGSTITKSIMLLEGDWFDGEPAGTPPSDPGELDLDTFRGIQIHEIGHFVGLGHSIINRGETGIDGCPDPVLENFVVMNPTGPGVAPTLHTDDRVGLSELYPTAAFAATPRISGRLVDTENQPFFGANIILRPQTSDCDALYDDAQATQSGAFTDTAGLGGFTFADLGAGTGYTVEAKSIFQNGGFPIGSNNPPQMPGPDEFYNAFNEDWFQPPDSPGQSFPVFPGGDDIEIRINRSDSAGALPATGPDALRVDKFDGETGLPPNPIVLDDGSVTGAWGFGGATLMAWVNRFSPSAEELPFRIERMDLMFWHPSAAPGRAIQLLVYVDPSGSGNPANATLVHTENTTIQGPLSDDVFQEFTLSSPVVVTSGDAYLGVIDQVADAATNFIGAFDLDAPGGRAYLQTNSTAPSGFALCQPGNGNCPDSRTWMIRAFGSRIPPAGTIALFWGDPCNAATAPGQDFGVYRANLGVATHDPIACSTGGRQFYQVADDPADRSWLVSPQLLSREASLAPHALSSTCRTAAAPDCP